MTVYITYHGVDGSGRNVTEAKRDAGRRIEKSLSGSFEPQVIAVGDFIGLMWRHPLYGWQHSVRKLSDFGADGHTFGGISTGGESESRDECERKLRFYLACDATPWQSCNRVEDVNNVCMEPQDRREIVSRHQWQQRFHRALGAGLNHNDAHAWAGGWTAGISVPIPDSLQPWWKAGVA